MSFKASDLVKKKKESDDLSEYNYKVQLDKCYTHIKNIHQNCKDDVFTFFNIPVVLYDNPNYNSLKCKEYLKKKLKENEFYVETSASSANSLYISWKPEDVSKIKQELDYIKQKKMEEYNKNQVLERQSIENRKKQQIKWKPSSAISDLKVKAALMQDNPKYAHLKNLKKK
jgi:hypothetical protein